MTSVGAICLFIGLRILLPTLPTDHWIRRVVRMHYEVCIILAMACIIGRSSIDAWLVPGLCIGALSCTLTFAYCIKLREKLLIGHMFAIFAASLAIPWAEADALFGQK